MKVFETMKKRRSIRKYEGKAISKENLEEIALSALLAPSGMKARSWECIIVEEREALDFIADSKKGSGAQMLKGATAGVMLLVKDNTETWIEDAAAAMTQMHLTATDLGLGSCWIQARDKDSNTDKKMEELLQDYFKFPEGYRVHSVLSLGHPDEEKSEYDLEELRTKIHWEKY